MTQEKIDPGRLIPMDIFEVSSPVRVELAYAGPKSFCGVIYHPQARLWLHEDLAAIVLLAAAKCHKSAGVRMVIYDGLRTTTAQALMLATPIVRANPRWIEGEDRVLSSPGMGGHPRGMAVDVSLESPEGVLLDMGTAFDEFPDGGSGPDSNRAHRLYARLSQQVQANRRLLEDCMVAAAHDLNLPLLPLPVEWWDFRFPASHSKQFAPLSDEELPRQMRMTAQHLDAHAPPDFAPAHFEKKKAGLMKRIAQFL